MRRHFVYTLALFFVITIANCQSDEVQYLPLSKNANEFDAGTFINNSAKWVNDRFGNEDEALYFDGKGENAVISAPSYLPFIGDFTFSFWLKTKSQHRIEAFSLATESDNNFNIDLSSNGVWVYWNGGGSYGINVENAKLADGLWHHLLVTRKQSKVSLYVDGLFKQSTNYNHPIGTFADLYMGGVTFPYEGALDELKIFSSSLTEQEVQDIFNESPYFDFPNSSSTLFGGQSANVILRGVRTGEVDLEVSYDSESWDVVQNNLPLKNELYRWSTPSINRQGKFRIKESATGAVLATSEEFKIREPSISKEYSWEKVTDNALFKPRDGSGALLLNDKVWLLGGWNPDEFETATTNELWVSTDAEDWEFKGYAPWEARHLAGWASFKNQLWVIGGDVNQERYQMDIWNSSDGVNWNRIMETSPWPNRASQMVAAFDNKLWMMGGQEFNLGSLEGGALYNDVWQSTDGINWTMVTPHAPWSGRGFGNVVVFKNRLWLLGGGNYNSPKEYFNEVWSTTDGVEWIKHADTPWRPRFFHNAVAFDNKLWVIGGFGNNNVNMGDVWYSDDGERWTQMEDVPWLPRHAATTFVLNNNLYISSGTAGNHPQELVNDIWKLSPKLAVEFPNDEFVIVDFGESYRLQTGLSPKLTYEWFRNDELMQVNNQNFIDIDDDGEYFLVITNQLNGLYGESKKINILVKPKVDLNVTPDTTGHDRIIMETYYDPSYQYRWFLNGIHIPNIDTSSIIIQFDGEYFVEARKKNGLKVSSQSINILIERNEFLETNSTLFLQNSNQELFVGYHNPLENGKISFQLVDINGRVLYSAVSEKTEPTKVFSADISNFKTGMFIAIVKTQTDIKSKKIVKR